MKVATMPTHQRRELAKIRGRLRLLAQLSTTAVEQGKFSEYIDLVTDLQNQCSEIRKGYRIEEVK